MTHACTLRLSVYRRTPLQCAAYGGFVNCMSVLIEHKADTDSQDHEVRRSYIQYNSCHPVMLGKLAYNKIIEKSKLKSVLVLSHLEYRVLQEWIHL